MPSSGRSRIFWNARPIPSAASTAGDQTGRAVRVALPSFLLPSAQDCSPAVGSDRFAHPLHQLELGLADLDQRNTVSPALIAIVAHFIDTLGDEVDAETGLSGAIEGRWRDFRRVERVPPMMQPDRDMGGEGLGFQENPPIGAAMVSVLHDIAARLRDRQLELANAFFIERRIRKIAANRANECPRPRKLCENTADLYLRARQGKRSLSSIDGPTSKNTGQSVRNSCSLDFLPGVSARHFGGSGSVGDLVIRADGDGWIPHEAPLDLSLGCFPHRLIFCADVLVIGVLDDFVFAGLMVTDPLDPGPDLLSKNVVQTGSCLDNPEERLQGS